MKDGGSANKTHVLDVANYNYWKPMMVAFLKSIGKKAWKVMIKGWKHLVITFEDGTTSLKPKAEWMDAEEEEALGNYKALNAILNGVDKNMSKLINTCSEAKKKHGRFS